MKELYRVVVVVEVEAVGEKLVSISMKTLSLRGLKEK